MDSLMKPLTQQIVIDTNSVPGAGLDLLSPALLPRHPNGLPEDQIAPDFLDLLGSSISLSLSISSPDPIPCFPAGPGLYVGSTLPCQLLLPAKPLTLRGHCFASGCHWLGVRQPNHLSQPQILGWLDLMSWLRLNSVKAVIGCGAHAVDLCLLTPFSRG